MWRTLEASLSDIDKYLDSPPVNWSHHMIGDADAEWVLKWWKANPFNFPLIAKVARDYLPTPSAEVGIEREFNNARDVLGLQKHRLNADSMRWLMLLREKSYCYRPLPSVLSSKAETQGRTSRSNDSQTNEVLIQPMEPKTTCYHHVTW